MRTLHAAQEDCRTLHPAHTVGRTGSAILFLLEVDLVSGGVTSTQRWSTWPATVGGNSYSAIMQDLTDCAHAISATGVDEQWLADALDDGLTLLNLPEDANRVEVLTDLYRFEGSAARLYWMFWHSGTFADGEKNELFTMTVDWVEWSSETATFYFTDRLLAALERMVADTTINGRDFANSPSISRGKVIPNVFGAAEQVELLPIEMGKRCAVRGSVVPGDRLIYGKFISADPTAEDYLAPGMWVRIGTELLQIQAGNDAVNYTESYFKTTAPAASSHADGDEINERRYNQAAMREEYAFAVARRATAAWNVRSDGQPVTSSLMVMEGAAPKIFTKTFGPLVGVPYIILTGAPTRFSLAGTLEKLVLNSEHWFLGSYPAITYADGSSDAHPVWKAATTLAQLPAGATLCIDPTSAIDGGSRTIAALARTADTLRLYFGKVTAKPMLGKPLRVRLAIDYSGNSRGSTTFFQKDPSLVVTMPSGGGTIIDELNRPATRVSNIIMPPSFQTELGRNIQLIDPATGQPIDSRLYFSEQRNLTSGASGNALLIEQEDAGDGSWLWRQAWPVIGAVVSSAAHWGPRNLETAANPTSAGSHRIEGSYSFGNFPVNAEVFIAAWNDTGAGSHVGKVESVGGITTGSATTYFMIVTGSLPKLDGLTRVWTQTWCPEVVDINQEVARVTSAADVENSPVSSVASVNIMDIGPHVRAGWTRQNHFIRWRISRLGLSASNQAGALTVKIKSSQCPVNGAFEATGTKTADSFPTGLKMTIQRGAPGALATQTVAMSVHDPSPGFDPNSFSGDPGAGVRQCTFWFPTNEEKAAFNDPANTDCYYLAIEAPWVLDMISTGWTFNGGIGIESLVLETDAVVNVFSTLIGGQRQMQVGVGPLGAIQFDAPTETATKYVDLTEKIRLIGKGDLAAGLETWLAAQTIVDIQWKPGGNDLSEWYVADVRMELEQYPGVWSSGFGKITADVLGEHGGGATFTNPVDILEHLLTHTEFGGLPAALLDSTSWTALKNNRAGVTRNRVVRGARVGELAMSLLRDIRARMFWSAGKLHLAEIPMHISASAAVVNIGATNILSSIITKDGQRTGDITNAMVLDYDQDANSGTARSRTAEAINYASKSLSWGKRLKVCSMAWGHKAAQVQANYQRDWLLARLSDVRYVIQLETDLTMINLERGDVVTISDTRSRLESLPGEVVGIAFGENFGSLILSIALDTQGVRTVFWQHSATTYIAVAPGETAAVFVINGIVVARFDATGDWSLRKGVDEVRRFPSVERAAMIEWDEYWNAIRVNVNVNTKASPRWYGGMLITADGRLMWDGNIAAGAGGHAVIEKQELGASGGALIFDYPDLMPGIFWHIDRIWFILQDTIVGQLDLRHMSEDIAYDTRFKTKGRVIENAQL